ncbi:MAG: ferrous iron transport protein B [Oscillospiraceae bacterium]
MEKRIALVGNPNSGKTTLFNTLTASKEYVGNRAGVTVDKKEAPLKGRGGVKIIDLPGGYSLTVYSPEERATLDYLLYEKPDVILNIVDATNIRRNLYLTTQLLDLGIPMIIALNMVDEAKKLGILPDIARLSKGLGCEVIGISALSGEGVPEAVNTAIGLAENRIRPKPKPFSVCVEDALGRISQQLRSTPREQRRLHAIRIFERSEKPPRSADEAAVEQYITACEEELGDRSDSIIAAERYRIIDSLVKRPERAKNALSATRRIDRVLANGAAAIPLFAVIITAVYFLSITLTGRLCEGLDSLVRVIGDRLDKVLFSFGCTEWLSSLITDGIVSGVGAVLRFVPQLFVLFSFLSFLEECGYMSRIAFILDRVFRRFGMSGKSVIPLIIGSGCGAVGVSASRTIENDSCRRMSVITTTFIPCSAKLPLISLIGATALSGAWWAAPAAYFIGIASVFLSGIILKNTKPFRGESAPFIMELPAYRLPRLTTIVKAAWERVWGFIKKAETVILLSSIAVRAGCMLGITDGGIVLSTELPLSESIFGKIGGLLVPVFAPLGFGKPEAAAAVIMGLAAKEEIVAVLGITGFSGFTAAEGLSFMVFNLLCAPCVAAIAAIRREMGSAKWTVFAVGYQCVFAYVASLLTYQIGKIIL